jgi:hypothetical protein
MIEWTESMKDRIFELISTGSSIAEIAGTEGFPAQSTFYRKMADDDEFARFIARAREAQQDHEADYCIQLADSATPEDYNVKKLQIWARQWRASKLAPKKYGEKVHQEITGANGGPLQSQTVTITPEIENQIKRIAERSTALKPPPRIG